ncbi:MAG: Gfo/Idh/MocA family oxidoreductase [Spirochaetes bacterium]|nr:Gfo/Idh/MocA family oxidoreductase [Spirochaetota bacterium]
MGKNIKIGLIGAGYWGKNLLRNFLNLGVLDVVCELDDTIIKERKKDYPDLKYTDDTEKIFKSKDIAGVAIATPAATHYSIAKEALLNNKHVFVEKPLALNIQQGEELIALAEKKKKILMVGHILQYHPAVIKLSELINKGELGKIHYIYSNRLNIGKLRNEENILWSFAPHDVSVILMLINKFPEKISANGGAYVQKDIYDVTMTNFSFAGGIRGHIFVSWLHPIKEQKLVVVGDNKMAVFDDTSDKKLLLYPHKIEWKNQIPVARKADAEEVALPEGEPLKNECQAFMDAIKSGKPPITDGKEGLRVLEFLKTAEEAISSHDEAEKSSFAKAGDFYAHPSAIVEEGANVGKGTKVWHFAHVMKGAKVGENCIIGQNVYVDKRAIIGNGVKIQNNVSVYDDVILEDGAFCGPSMVFTNVNNPRSFIERKDEYRKTIVRKGASIGANATVVCGHNIGKYAFIGAGTVVTKHIPDYALVVGVPGKIMGWMCKCGIRIEFKKNKAKCPACGNEYKKTGDKVTPLKEK